MPVHLYTITWNEADMLGFFFRHYDPWVDRYVIHDNGSTDGTLDLLRAHPRVEIRRFERVHADSFVLSHTRLQNQVWKESACTADWVVITAVDEHLHLPDQPVQDYLQDCTRQGVTCIPALGYQMYSREMADPAERLCETRTMGVPFEPFNKLSLFNPSAVSATGYEVGRHLAKPSGRIRWPERDRLLLLHYKCIGYERSWQRDYFLKSGLGPTDLARGYGMHYLQSAAEFQTTWEEYERRVEDIARPDLHPWRTHPGRRPWRSAWWHWRRRFAWG
jgi:hypothetical protein